MMSRSNIEMRAKWAAAQEDAKAFREAAYIVERAIEEGHELDLQNAPREGRSFSVNKEEYRLLAKCGLHSNVVGARVVLADSPNRNNSI